MERQVRIGPSRRDEQSVEITFAIFTGVAVFLGLVIPAVVSAHILGLTNAGGWGPIGAGFAAVAGLASTISIVARARQRGL